MTLKINKITTTTGGVESVELEGSIDETAMETLAELDRRCGKVCRIDFAKVARINSHGLRLWIQFMRLFKAKRQVTFIRCSTDVVVQMDLVPGFRAGAHVESMFGSFYCGHCRIDVSLLFEAAEGAEKILERARRQVCPRCRQPISLDHAPENYFKFMKA